MRKRRRDREIIRAIISVLMVFAGLFIFTMMFFAFC